VYDDDSRTDLTERRVGEIGQLCLALAKGLKQHPYALSTRMVALGLSGAVDRLMLALSRLMNPDQLEIIRKKDLLLVKDILHDWLENQADSAEVARKLEDLGKTLYNDYWGMADPPQDLSGIVRELHKLRDVVASYNPDDQLVIGHAKWIASVISTIFHPDIFDLPDELLRAVRGHALAAITFLEDFALHTRGECLAFLQKTAAFLAEQAAVTDDSESGSYGNGELLQEGSGPSTLAGNRNGVLSASSVKTAEYQPGNRGPESAAFLPSGKSSNSIEDQFFFGYGQVLFDGKDLGLPSGEPIFVLQKLFNDFGSVVEYKRFDPHYTSAMPGSLPKSVSLIRTALRKHGVPCEVKSRRGEGYILRHIEMLKTRKKRVRKK
jgi:hypothetical protein